MSIATRSSFAPAAACARRCLRGLVHAAMLAAVVPAFAYDRTIIITNDERPIVSSSLPFEFEFDDATTDYGSFTFTIFGQGDFVGSYLMATLDGISLTVDDHSVIGPFEARTFSVSDTLGTGGLHFENGLSGLIGLSPGVDANEPGDYIGLRLVMGPVVPEPATCALMLAGLGLIAGLHLRREGCRARTALRTHS